MRNAAKLLQFLALAIALCCSAAEAQEYPTQPVRIIVGFTPGGPTDVVARVLADKLSSRLGKQFYVVNQPGAGSNTASGMAAAAPADGSTLLVVSTGFIINPHLFAKVPYDPARDFAPITVVALSPNLISVHPSVPANTLQELIALVKANPGKYSFAAPGAGSTPHLSGELFRQVQGLDLVTVQFSGAGQAIQSTVGGHTPVAFSAVPPAAPQVKEGLLRPLAVTAEKRIKALPDVPTTAEAGVPGQEGYTLTGILAPAGTPKEIVARLHREIAAIVELADVRQNLENLGFEVAVKGPEDFAQRIKTEGDKWGAIIRSAKLKLE